MSSRLDPRTDIHSRIPGLSGSGWVQLSARRPFDPRYAAGAISISNRLSAAAKRFRAPSAADDVCFARLHGRSPGHRSPDGSHANPRPVYLHSRATERKPNLQAYLRRFKLPSSAGQNWLFRQLAAVGIECTDLSGFTGRCRVSPFFRRDHAPTKMRVLNDGLRGRANPSRRTRA